MNKTDYQRYLGSREWAVLREAVRKRSNNRCERCWAGRHEDTHHLTYERKGRERLEDLQAVCSPCHRFLSAKSDIDPLKRPKDFGRIVLVPMKNKPWPDGGALNYWRREGVGFRLDPDGLVCIIIENEDVFSREAGWWLYAHRDEIATELRAEAQAQEVSA